MNVTSVALRVFSRMQSCLPVRFKNSCYLIGAAAAAAEGQGQQWLPEIYRAAVKDMGKPPTTQQPAIEDWTADLPRRQVSRQIKEVLLKSTILVGVGHCIEASFALGSVLEEGDKDDTFFRGEYTTDGRAYERGQYGLDRVYKQNHGPIHQKMTDFGLMDIHWLGPHITYGMLLAPTRPENPVAPLTFSETEIVILTCLMARHAHREVLWHLRGCLRSGMSAEEVEGCQQAIEACLDGLKETAETTHRPMPRVSDVTEVDDLS